MPIYEFPNWFVAAMLAPFGLILGSFANVLIHRLPLDEEADRNVVTKPSHCPSCHARIKAWHNIPLFAWLLLRGKCAACGWRIPLRYPLVELLGGLLLAGSVYIFPWGTLIWAKGVICGYALIVLFFTDFTAFTLPDVLQYPLIVLGVLFTLPQLLWPAHQTIIWAPNAVWLPTFANGLQTAPAWHFTYPPVTWINSLLGLSIGYGVPFLLNAAYRLIRKTDGIGMGDFKMLAWLGAFWGWAPMLGILFGGALLGSVVGIPLMITRKEGGQMMLPFGCALALATPVVVFFGPALWMAYMGMMN